MATDSPASQTPAAATYDVEAEVRRRYGQALAQGEPSLCCPASYTNESLKLIPAEILQKDYGCGDPTPFVNAGDVVVDLGSGAGKICYMLAQKVGKAGRVIGVDFHDDMLALSRKYLPVMARQLGYANVSFIKARIQDLALDLEQAQHWLAAHPINQVEALAAYETHCDYLRCEHPALADASVDAVVSNCVLNLVRASDKAALFQEIFRVLKRGGRAVISDIVSDEDATPEMMANPELWSACLSGALREDRLLAMFESAGFYGMEILSRQDAPWRVIDGIEFRSITVRAWQGKQGPCLERQQAAIYRGPWRQVMDDDGHTYWRGQRMAVCDKTYNILTNPAGPYTAAIIGVAPNQATPLEAAEPFPCDRDVLRAPQDTKRGGPAGQSLTASAVSCQPECC